MGETKLHRFARPKSQGFQPTRLNKIKWNWSKWSLKLCAYVCMFRLILELLLRKRWGEVKCAGQAADLQIFEFEAMGLWSFWNRFVLCKNCTCVR